MTAWADSAGRSSSPVPRHSAVLRRSAVLIAAITLLARAAGAQTQPAPEARHYLDLLTHRAEVVLEAASQAR